MQGTSHQPFLQHLSLILIWEHSRLCCSSIDFSCFSAPQVTANVQDFTSVIFVFYFCCYWTFPHSWVYLEILMPWHFFSWRLLHWCVSMCLVPCIFFQSCFFCCCFFWTNTASLYFCSQPFPFKVERKAAVMPYDQRAAASAAALCCAALSFLLF